MILSRRPGVAASVRSIASPEGVRTIQVETAREMPAAVGYRCTQTRRSSRRRWRPGALRRTKGDHASLDSEATIDLSDRNVIWLRHDPPCDMSYVTTTHLLDLLTPGTLVVNDPYWVRNSPEKPLVLRNCSGRFAMPVLQKWLYGVSSGGRPRRLWRRRGGFATWASSDS